MNNERSIYGESHKLKMSKHIHAFRRTMGRDAHRPATPSGSIIIIFWILFVIIWFADEPVDGEMCSGIFMWMHTIYRYRVQPRYAFANRLIHATTAPHGTSIEIRRNDKFKPFIHASCSISCGPALFSLCVIGTPPVHLMNWISFLICFTVESSAFSERLSFVIYFRYISVIHFTYRRRFCLVCCTGVIAWLLLFMCIQKFQSRAMG